MRAAVALAGLLAVWIGSEGETMAEELDKTRTMPPVLVLDPEPLAPDEVFATVDIVSKQGRLGGEGDLPVREGRASVGKPRVYDLPEPTAHLQPLSQGERWRYYLAVFPFTLHPPLHGRRFLEMTFTVVLPDSRATAFQLWPDRIVSEEDVTKSSDIGLTVSLPGGKAGGPVDGELSANAKQIVKFTRLRPVITAFGNGQSRFYWRYTGSSGVPLDPGDRLTAAVLQVPADVERLDATVEWSVDLERRVFDQWRNIPATLENVQQLPLPLR